MSNYTISETQAVNETTDYRTGYGENATRAFKIDKAEIDEIFQDHPDAAGVRAYLGKRGDGLSLIVVAVDADGKDILDKFYDHMKPCPEFCDTSSILNNGN